MGLKCIATRSEPITHSGLVQVDAKSQIHLEGFGMAALALPTDGATVKDAADGVGTKDCEDADDSEAPELSPLVVQ